MKKIMSVVLVALMIFSCVGTAFAASTSTPSSLDAQDTDYINELIDLASEAARSGEKQLAYQYEEMLQELGVEVMTGDEVWDFYVNEINNGVEPILDDVVKPPNTSSIHWYKTTYMNHPYAGKSYDVITIRATSWDDTSDWLHVEQTLKNKKKQSSIPLASLEYIFEAGADKVEGLLGLVTIKSIFEKAFLTFSKYEYLDVNPGDIICMFTADIDVMWHWVREHNSPKDDYVIRLEENKIVGDYSYIHYIRATEPNGKVTTKSSGELTVPFEYERDDFGDIDRACQAFLDDKIREVNVGDIELKFNNESLTIPEFILPPYLG